jgi:hypothetical protein
MTTLPTIPETARVGRVSPLVSWALIAGGLFYFIGGGLHPSEDHPELTLKQQLRLMYDDPAWYPSHTMLLAGIMCLALALVVLARGGVLRPVPIAHRAAVVAAVTSTIAAAASLLHLVSGSEADEIAAGHGTPISDGQIVSETITTPLFGLSIAALAVIGAATRTLGNWPGAVLGAIGGLAYALAGGTFLLTDALNFLFPVSSGIALWAAITGIMLQWRARRQGTRL